MSRRQPHVIARDEITRRSDTAGGGRIVGADGLRAIACLWVFVTHVDYFHGGELLAGWPVAHRLVQRGDHGVAMFFVLSGFLLSQPFWKAHERGDGLPDLRRYVLRRLARIVPAYWLCITILAVLNHAWSGPWNCARLALMYSFTNTLVRATYLPEFDIPLWSISIEMLFYMMLPIFAWELVRLRSRWAARLYAVGTISAIVLMQRVLLNAAPTLERWINDPTLFAADGGSVRNNALKLFAHFLVGVLAADAYLDLRRRNGASHTVPTTSFNSYDGVAVVALTLAVVIQFTPHQWLPVVRFMSYHWPGFPVLIGLLLVVLPFTHWVGPCLDGVFLRWIAAISYGLYIWHVPVMAGVARYWPTPPDTNSVTLGAFALCSFTAACLLASASYYLVEKPILEWVHRRPARRHANHPRNHV